LSIRRAAVSLTGGAHVEIGVDVDRNPVSRAERVGYRRARRIGNVASAAETKNFFAVFQDLRDDRLIRNRRRLNFPRRKS
jgi:hypothetical protein